MQKKLMRTLKPGSISLLVLLSIGFSSLNLSCNEQNKKSTDKVEKDPAVLATTLDKFPVLYIPFQEIKNAFNKAPGNQIKKIVFKFHFDGGVSKGQPTLTGYSAKQNGAFDPTPPETITLSKADTAIALGYPLNLSTIEFTRPEYESLLNNATNPPQQFLVFIPLKSAIYLNSVTYKTAWSNIQPALKEIRTLQVGDELKPSPPAPPYY